MGFPGDNPGENFVGKSENRGSQKRKRRTVRGREMKKKEEKGKERFEEGERGRSWKRVYKS